MAVSPTQPAYGQAGEEKSSYNCACKLLGSIDKIITQKAMTQLFALILEYIFIPLNHLYNKLQIYDFFSENANKIKQKRKKNNPRQSKKIE